MKNQLEKTAARTKSDFPDVTLNALISKSAEANSDRIAVEHEDQTLTYRQLEIRSNQLAQFLISRGVQHQQAVGVCVERNTDAIVALLGVLKAGGLYLPLDPDYPADRLCYMCEDAGTKIVLQHDSLQDLTKQFGAQYVSLDSQWNEIQSMPADCPRISQSVNDPAYMIYTSGSTGNPKGVEIAHRSAVNMLWSLKEKPGFSAVDTMLGMTTLSFDISVVEMFLPLIAGGKAAIVSREVAKDPHRLIAAIDHHGVTVMQATPSTWQFVVEAGWNGNTTNLKAITGGEQLSADLAQRLFDRSSELWNIYGPTETCVYSVRYQVKDPNQTILIGEPLENTSICIVDESNNEVAVGEEGELLIGGTGVAIGYHNLDDLNATKFIELDGHRVYRTGDLCKWTEDGKVQCLGRIDSQVKLHGHRIELGEVEAALAKQPNVQRAAATVREDIPGDKRLVGYVIAQQNEKLDLRAIKTELEKSLPDYMVPSQLVVCESFPQTPGAKLDRKALPKPTCQRPEIDVEYVGPVGEQESQVTRIMADVLQIDKVGRNDSFFKLGGNSILALKVIANIEKTIGLRFTAAEFFDNPSPVKLLAYDVSRNKQPASATISNNSAKNDDIAIIGMSVRLPGANSVAEFWKLMIEGHETTKFFAPEELDPTLGKSITDPAYVAARGIVDDPDKFDSQFFGIAPREAELIDPQQRLLLELAWVALEDAGVIPNKTDATIGVWAGSYNNTYYIKNLLTHPEIIEKTGEFQLGVYNEKDYIASRIANRLNLRGPAINVNTACSTSLVAVIEAAKSLTLGHCDVALAGAASVTFPQYSGHVHQTGSIMSPDGHCRPFDSDGAGTVFSDGAGIVVLKRLSEAQRDGDRIYAVVKGVGLNNDGGDKASFTAPSIDGQVGAISMAHADAGINAESIEYIEAHGTATPIGDPIEFTALNRVFTAQTDKKQYCGLGSVKSNFGHTVSAAGVTGLIKTVLSLYQEQIPATLHYQKPNPQIDFENSPFSVVAKNRPWPRRDESPRLAGVSSFGVGGTNAHVVVQEAPAGADEHHDSRPFQVLPLSAKSENALEAQVENMRAWLTEEQSHPTLEKIAYSLQTGRDDFNYRAFVVADNFDSAITALEKRNPLVFSKRKYEDKPRELMFMFPGQGSQYVGMGQNLYRDLPVFRENMDYCSEFLQGLIGHDLRDVLYPADLGSEKAQEILRSTEFTQPALFAIEYSLAQLWLSWGLRPESLMGHSVGEFVAACLAGVFSLDDGLRLIAKRGELIASVERGDMLSVRADVVDVQPLLTGQLSIAAANAPQLTVVAGPHDEIASLQKQLETQGFACKHLLTSHAFHSPMMDCVVEPFRKFVETIQLHKPNLPIMSTVNADWMTDEQATDPSYWAAHLRSTVDFTGAIKSLWQNDSSRVLLEVGPRSTLTTLAKRHVLKSKEHVAVSSLNDRCEANEEWFAVQKAIGGLWLAGISVDWQAVYPIHPQHASIPTYAFQRKLHFVEPATLTTISAPMQPENLLADEVSNIVQSLSSECEDVLTPSTTVDSTISPISAEQKLDSTVASRRDAIIAAVKKIFEDTSGFEFDDFDDSMTFLEIGMDSLILTQTSSALKRELGIEVSFRQLLEQTPNIELLADYLDTELPESQFADTSEPVASVSTPVTSPAPTQNPVPEAKSELENPNGAKPKKSFGAAAKVALSDDTLTPQQEKAIQTFVESYVAKTPTSKQQAQSHRAYFADPRTVSGFRPTLKEMTYPIVVNRSKGVHLWDVDGNQYIDVTCGFGSNFLGHSPDFMIEAMTQQLNTDYAIGPQTPLAGEVARIFTEMTGMERVAFCNTGSEAVLGAMRLARTATGRDKFVSFNGDYHGILDEYIVRGNSKMKTFPAASGIPKSAVGNVLILEYGDENSLRVIQENMNDLAAVLVEPVQSRKPEFQPREFLQKLDALLKDEEPALIFDEVITGFRIAPGGAQQHFGVRADIATYGKIPGGGLPFGAVAGRGKYLDGLDGGMWRFGDDSKPEAGMTYFAGTFVRHPLTMAAAKAILTHLRSIGQEGYDKVNALADRMAAEPNNLFRKSGAPLFLANFGTLFKVQLQEDLCYGELLFAGLRQRGIHIYDGRPCLLTLAHRDEHVDAIIQAFHETIAELQQFGFMPGDNPANIDPQPMQKVSLSRTPPVEGARLGKDRVGHPGWFVPDLANPGQYVQV